MRVEGAKRWLHAGTTKALEKGWKKLREEWVEVRRSAGFVVPCLVRFALSAGRLSSFSPTGSLTFAWLPISCHPVS